MENLEIATAAILEQFDKQLKELLLAELRQVIVKQAA